MHLTHTPHSVHLLIHTQHMHTSVRHFENTRKPNRPVTHKQVQIHTKTTPENHTFDIVHLLHIIINKIQGSIYEITSTNSAQFSYQIFSYVKETIKKFI